MARTAQNITKTAALSAALSPPSKGGAVTRRGITHSLQIQAYEKALFVEQELRELGRKYLAEQERLNKITTMSRAKKYEAAKAQIAWFENYKSYAGLSDEEKIARTECGKAFSSLVNMSSETINALQSWCVPKETMSKLKGTPKSMWDDEDWRYAKSFVRMIQTCLKNNLPTESFGHSRLIESQKAVTIAEGTNTFLEIEKGLAAFESITSTYGQDYTDLLKNQGVDLSPYSRVIKIVPSVERIDLQHQLVTLDALRASWKFFEKYGNVDIEHLTRMSLSESEAKKRIVAAGFPYDPNVGRVFWEIGRPIPNSFNTADCSFLAYIYEDKASNKSAANWYWSTVTERYPPTPWKASIGGFIQSPVPTILQNNDEVLGVKRLQLVGVVKKWSWNNCTQTLSPVNFHVPPTEIIKNTSTEGNNDE
jgi:hypothetical protein